MRRKNATERRLSPNEEAQLAREEQQRRRKLRIQQVREQERNIALQVRREVQERKDRELKNLTVILRDEWQKHKEQKIETLENLYKENLREVGQGHSNAKQNEPDWDALALKRDENKKRAAERHQKALCELVSQRQAAEEQHNRPIITRKKALGVEKERAAKIAGLPKPATNPIESIGNQIAQPYKSASVERYSITHHHIVETAVARENCGAQLDAQQAAVLETQCLEKLEKEQARDKQEQLEKARLRGDHALRKEKAAQERVRLLSELERFQQTDLQRRRLLVNSVPAQIFQPLYRHDLIRAEQQRELEIAFQDLCTEERELKGDFILQLESEPLPLPAPSVKSENGPSCDHDLDVSLEPNSTRCQETGVEEQEELTASPMQSTDPSPPVGGTSRVALRRLLERIRTQQGQWSRRGHPEAERSTEVEDLKAVVECESGPQWQQASSLEEETINTSVSEMSSEHGEDLTVTGGVLQPDEKDEETDRKHKKVEDLQRQQKEQLAMLQVLKEKQRSLELQLEEAQLQREKLQDAFNEQSMKCSLQEPARPLQEEITEPLPEVNVLAPLSDGHTNRLQQYQQRLLQQNRRFVEDGMRRLEEYRQTLKLRYGAVSVPELQPPPPSSNEETSCSYSSFDDRTLPPAPMVNSNLSRGHSYSHETPAMDIESSCRTKNAEHADSAEVIQYHDHNSVPDLTTHQDGPCLQMAAHSTLPGFISLARQCEESVQLASPRETRSLVLNDNRQRDASDEEDIPLPPPSFVLELLLNSRSANATRMAPVSRGITAASYKSEVEANQQDELKVIEMRASKMSHNDAHHFERTNRVLPSDESLSQHHDLTYSPMHVPIEFSDSLSAVGLKPPTFPPRPLHNLLQDLELHKLSTIQEVNTPADVTLDTGTEESMESLSCTDDYTVPVNEKTESESDQELSSRSEAMTLQPSTAHSRSSKLSWRETLELESAASYTAEDMVALQPVNESELTLPHDESCAELGYLTSTTLTTGSYSTSEHDTHSTMPESSLHSNESTVGVGASVSCSSSLWSCEVPRPIVSSSSLQHIIDKYTKEMDESLRSVLLGSFHSIPADATENTVLTTTTDNNLVTGVITDAPQLSVAAHDLLDHRKSISTIMHDTFQSLSPEMTNNETAECSMAFQIPLKGHSSPCVEEITTNTDTANSDWLYYRLPTNTFSTDDQTTSGFAGCSQMEWTLGSLAASYLQKNK